MPTCPPGKTPRRGTTFTNKKGHEVHRQGTCVKPRSNRLRTGDLDNLFGESKPKRKYTRRVHKPNEAATDKLLSRLSRRRKSS